jgi:hypothetical protein
MNCPRHKAGHFWAILKGIVLVVFPSLWQNTQDDQLKGKIYFGLHSRLSVMAS